MSLIDKQINDTIINTKEHLNNYVVSLKESIENEATIDEQEGSRMIAMIDTFSNTYISNNFDASKVKLAKKIKKKSDKEAKPKRTSAWIEYTNAMALEWEGNYTNMPDLKKMCSDPWQAVKDNSDNSELKMYQDIAFKKNEEEAKRFYNIEKDSMETLAIENSDISMSYQFEDNTTDTVKEDTTDTVEDTVTKNVEKTPTKKAEKEIALKVVKKKIKSKSQNDSSIEEKREDYDEMSEEHR
jgi:hypothetical protein